jgi:DUF4097 and DUF4098 domain-containing protein YvlB
VPLFETPGSVELQIRLPAGRATVKTADEPITNVELIPRGRRGEEAIEEIVVRADEKPGGHVISIERKDRIKWGPLSITWGEGDVEIHVTCPTGTDVDFNGASADLSALGSYGKVAAKTASGDLRLGEVAGGLQVKTASGDVFVQRIEDESSLQTVSGDVDIEQVDASLTARTVSGDVDLGRVRASLILGTTSGDVAVKAVERGEVKIQTVSGDARVGVAQGTAVWMDAVSVSGTLRSELGVAEDAPDHEGDDIVPLQVKTVSGDVSFVRASPPVAD